MNSNDKRILLYYLFMLVILLFLTRPNASYGILFRLAYLGMLIVPLFINPRFTPFVITCFYGISMNACYSLLPERFEFCIFIVLVLFFRNFESLHIQYKDIRNLIVFYVYSLLISTVNLDIQQKFLSIGYIAILLFPFIKDERDTRLLALGISLMSTVLAILYFKFFNYYSFYLGIHNEFETGTWQNMNVLAGAIGCGLLSTISLLLDVFNGRDTVLFKFFLISGCILMVFALASLSSRGAILATISASALLILNSKIKLWLKTIIAIGASLLVFLMYYNGYLDLFIFRMNLSNFDTFGNRTIIWHNKLTPFFSDSVLVQLFGMGREQCMFYGGFRSTHNDFVTSLVGFGYLGFILMVQFIVAPMFKAINRDFIQISALSLFMIMECMVLEPFYRGHLQFWVFYLLVVKLADIKRQKNN